MRRLLAINRVAMPVVGTALLIALVLVDGTWVTKIGWLDRKSVV